MEETQTKIYQVFAKLLDGKSRTLNFLTPIIPIASLKAQIQTLTSIPIHQQLLISDGKTLYDGAVLRHGGSSPSTVNLLLRLRGGKGGFGSLLRGAATKAGQKKTNNFDACRDMSGRRLRHVNAEKKMEEWLADEKERKLEKVAEEFIKKKVKAVKKAGGGGDGAEKYVEKYRKDSEKCREEVEKSVRESLGGGGLKSKRKTVGVEVAGGGGGGLKAKKLKIWIGKRKMDDSDSNSDDTDEEDRDDEMGEENEKSAVTNNEKNPSDSSSASVTCGKMEGQSSVGCSSESGSEEEKETVPLEQPCKDSDDGSHGDGVDEENTVQNSNVAMEAGVKSVVSETEKPERADELPSTGSVQEAGASDVQVNISDSEIIVEEETVSTKSDSPDLEKPLNFDEFNSAAELEVLGMERLKSELQKRGLKCGGTLNERAARLFLLKTTPLEMLPKKLLAKK